ncbi:MAG: FAD-dependent oxidoreductase [Chitinispirillaceae bacterium]|nr:FAD-dependent oxidoreductase [Chitinispirillaceae bacterium]
MTKILIIGGVAGGASFAARMRRLDEQAEIIMFDKGEYISFANCGLPYHIGDVITDREDLILQTPERFNARYNIDVRVRSEVTAINTTEKTVSIKTPERSYTENYDILLLSPGSTPIRPPIPGIENDLIFTLRTIPDMDRIKTFARKTGKGHAVVIGGGFIGLEVAENLRHIGHSVSLVELADQVFAPADREMANILHRHMQHKGIDLYLTKGADKFSKTGDGKIITFLSSGKQLVADFVVLAIGVRPDTGFLSDSGIALNKQGAIIVDEHMRTNSTDVYAVGDAVEVTDLVAGVKASMPLAGPANRQARIAADNAAGIPSTYKHTQGTAICKVFDLTAAVTGISEKNARKLGIPYLKSYTHSSSHASYYPGATTMSVKLLFAPDTGRVLGAQIIGEEGVDKRIDVFATAVRHRLTVSDLTELELSYAPPFGSAKDPVNMAGYVAENILSGRMPHFHVEDLEGRDDATSVLLDVRTRGEHAAGTIQGSVLIPVDKLRERIAELDKKKEIQVYCRVGLRGYIAARILLENGFRVKNLSGGYLTYKAANYNGDPE